MAKGEGGRAREFISVFLLYCRSCCEGFKNNELHYKGAGERHRVSGILLKESTKHKAAKGTQVWSYISSLVDPSFCGASHDGSRRERNSVTRSAIHQHGLGAKSPGRTFGVRLFHPAT
jgi:hypothetical protein